MSTPLNPTDAPIALPQIGQRVDDRYVVTGILGRGGFGIVYEARDERTGGVVALKVLDLTRRNNPMVLARFQREVDLIASLRHPNTIRITDRGQTAEGAPFYVMERLTGEPLDAMLEREGPLPFERVVDVLQQTLRSLSEAHAANIVHRDIKPANIFVTPTGRSSIHITMLDFGIAKSLAEESEQVTESREVPCSPQYVAPERVVSLAATPASDIYSLGHVIIELLDGVPAFQAPTSMALLLLHADTDIEVPLGETSASSPIANILERAVAKDPANRFANASAMLEALEAQLQTRIDPVAAPSQREIDRVGETLFASTLAETTHDQPRLNEGAQVADSVGTADTMSTIYTAKLLPKRVATEIAPTVLGNESDGFERPGVKRNNLIAAFAIVLLVIALVAGAASRTRHEPTPLSTLAPTAIELPPASPFTAPSPASEGSAPTDPHATDSSPEPTATAAIPEVAPARPALDNDNAADVRSSPRPDRTPQQDPPQIPVVTPELTTEEPPADPPASDLAPDDQQPQPTENTTPTEWGLGLSPR